MTEQHKLRETAAQLRAGVRAFVRQRVPEHEVDDVVQDVFVRVYEGLNALDQPSRLDAWVHTLTRRTVADFYRRRSPIQNDDADELDRLTAPAATDVHEEVLGWICPMIHLLPNGYREAVWWADVESVPQQVIAERLGISLSGAKSRVQRGRRQLAKLLHACCEVEFDSNGHAEEWRLRSQDSRRLDREEPQVCGCSEKSCS
ncbi:MAG: sigma-70 family RNA polymerase sigma factor [Bacteroidota bacterium]